MLGVITGDIINSSSSELASDFLKLIHKSLERLGEQGRDWEIFRGDSFQVEIADPQETFWRAVYIKACLKSKKNLDARMAIGIGKKDKKEVRVSQASGSAFLRSGRTFEVLKKERSNLLINTGNPILDKELNVYFQLGLLTMDAWSPNSAELVKLSIEKPDWNQKKMGQEIGIKQNTVSERLKRSALPYLQDFDGVFRQKINQIRL